MLFRSCSCIKTHFSLVYVLPSHRYPSQSRGRSSPSTKNTDKPNVSLSHISCESICCRVIFERCRLSWNKQYANILGQTPLTHPASPEILKILSERQITKTAGHFQLISVPLWQFSNVGKYQKWINLEYGKLRSTKFRKIDIKGSSVCGCTYHWGLTESALCAHRAQVWGGRADPNAHGKYFYSAAFWQRRPVKTLVTIRSFSPYWTIISLPRR